MTLVRRFAAHVRGSALLPPGSRVAVACSGGADSVALLLLLRETAGELGLAGVAAAHLDHALRPDSADDAAFVAGLARSLGVPFETARRRVRRARGESREEAARRVRYRWLAGAARALRCDLVATAHHLDDQAETVLYRALRGAGLAGLRGILPSADVGGARVVRPLLPFRREELRRWLRSRGVAWREDPTNDDVGPAGNDRARLRREVLPLVRRLLRRDPAAPLARLAEAAQREFARPAPAVAPHVPRRREAESPAAAARLVWEVLPVSNAVFLARIRAAPGTAELLDADRVQGALHVRAPRPGDRFHALGLPRAQRLGHYLQRRGVPAADRSAVPLLCDDRGVVAVGGHGIAARVAVRDDTSRVVVTRLVRNGGGSRPG